MKTSVELPDSLLREAKRLALRERTTVRALIERGLRTVIADRRPAAQVRTPEGELSRRRPRHRGVTA